jgi:hypothetical protein
MSWAKYWLKGYLMDGQLHPSKASSAFDVYAAKKWQSRNWALHVQKQSIKNKNRG